MVVDRLADSITTKMVLGQSAIKVNSSKSALLLARSPVLWLNDSKYPALDIQMVQSVMVNLSGCHDSSLSHVTQA